MAAEPLTEELLEELLESDDPLLYIEAHEVGERGLAEYLQQMLSEKGLSRAEVVREAGVSDTYGWYLFTGERQNPSRDIVLRLAFAMRLSLLETNRALQAANTSPLYCKNRRDAIIIYSICHGATLQETDEALYGFGVRTIGGEQ